MDILPARKTSGPPGHGDWAGREARSDDRAGQVRAESEDRTVGEQQLVGHRLVQQVVRDGDRFVRPATLLDARITAQQLVEGQALGAEEGRLLDFLGLLFVFTAGAFCSSAG